MTGDTPVLVRLVFIENERTVAKSYGADDGFWLDFNLAHGGATQANHICPAKKRAFQAPVLLSNINLRLKPSTNHLQQITSIT